MCDVLDRSIREEASDQRQMRIRRVCVILEHSRKEQVWTCKADISMP